MTGREQRLDASARVFIGEVVHEQHHRRHAERAREELSLSHDPGLRMIEHGPGRDALGLAVAMTTPMTAVEHWQRADGSVDLVALLDECRSDIGPWVIG